MHYSVRSDFSQVYSMLDDIERKQLPYATARGLTMTIKDANEELVKQMSSRFDRPTPWTLKGTYIKPATKTNLTASVEIKSDKLNAGAAAIDWLAHEIYGGQRILKRFEQLLIRANRMPSGTYLVPAKSMPLDQYGNVSRGEIQRVIADLSAQPFDASANSTKGSRQRRARSRTKRAVFYFSTYPSNQKTSHLKPGIYQRTLLGFGSSVRPAFLFVSKAQYRVRLPFDEIVANKAKERWPIRFEEALAIALATAR
jgi:hypothetical protein